MDGCADNITYVPPAHGFAEQWVIGPQGEEDVLFYTGGEARLECIAAALENITTESVRIAFFGLPQNEEYEEYGWQWLSVLTDLQVFSDALFELWQLRDAGEYTNAEALLELAQLFGPDFEWSDVRSAAVANQVGG